MIEKEKISSSEVEVNSKGIEIKDDEDSKIA